MEARQTDDVELSFLFLNLDMALQEFNDKRVLLCLTKRGICYKQDEVWNYAKPLLKKTFSLPSGVQTCG